MIKTHATVLVLSLFVSAPAAADQPERKITRITLSREIQVGKPHLHLPVTVGAQKRLLRWIVDEKMVRQFEIELAEGVPDFWMDTDIAPYIGKTVRIEVDRMPAESQALASIKQADRLPGGKDLYRESLRPQFHFSPARGWTNDPNGLVYADGEYHLFFQHNPFGTRWGNMTWGHALSTDLIQWTQLADALHPDALGTMFSGSAVVDHGNTTGWQQGGQQPIVCIYTSAGGTNLESKGQPFTQSVAYSIDRGRTWQKYDGNPVLGHIHGSNRDPKVFWHAPTNRWVMILYLEPRGKFALFGSPDLKQWRKLSDLPFPGGHECPDMFELAVDGDPNNRRWVVWEGGGLYLIGQFDGTTFRLENGPFASKFGGNDYAAQTYSDIPDADGRRIQISWMSGGKYPGMPFNQQMSVARVLTLRTTAEGVRMYFEPVEELKKLRAKHVQRQGISLDGTQAYSLGVTGALFDIEATIDSGQARTVGIEVRGHKVEYSVAEKQLTVLGKSAPLTPVAGRIKLRILTDRTSMEVFANDGRVQMANCFLPGADHQSLAVYATGGHATATQVNVWKLRSSWHQP